MLIDNIDLYIVAEPTIVRRLGKPVTPLVETEEPMAARRSPSPSRNPVNKIIHIRNLVRPFTLNQLKELLQRSGTLIDEYFWIDKIKSHCFCGVSSLEQYKFYNTGTFVCFHSW